MSRQVQMSRVKPAHFSEFVAAVGRDYEAHIDDPETRVYTGFDQETENTVLFFLRPDGSGFGCVEARPQDYVKYSKAMEQAMAAGHFELGDAHHPGVDEYEFEPGSMTAEYKSTSFQLDAQSSFF